jgi:hypothetical protein
MRTIGITGLLLLVASCLLGSGCDAMTTMADSQRILGKWQGSLDSLEFFGNGDLRAYAVLKTHQGKWRMPGGNRLQLEVPGIFYGTMKAEWRYEITGNKLILTAMEGGMKLEYHR